MREREFLASLRQLKAMRVGGYPVTRLDPKAQGFWLRDVPNGFLHWIVYMATHPPAPEWRGEHES